MKILDSEEMIVDYELFKHSPRYYFSAKALTDCEIIMIKKEIFEDFILNDPAAMRSAVNWLSTRS